MSSIPLWRHLEKVRQCSVDEIKSLLKQHNFEKLWKKYQTLFSSRRAGCIGYSYKKLFPNADSIINIYKRKGFEIEPESGEGNHVKSVSFSLNEYFAHCSHLSPRIHIDFLPLNKHGSNLWAIPHIDPHDPKIEPDKHRIDKQQKIYIPPCPELKNLIKLLIGKKKIRKADLEFISTALSNTY